MLAPIAQITCIETKINPPAPAIPPGENVVSVETMKTSANTSHTPRVKSRVPNSLRLFFAPIRPALTPASATNTGAQKWVIHRVANKPAEMCGLPIGSCSAPNKK